MREYLKELSERIRYLIDRGVKGGCLIRGEPLAGQGVDLVFDEPELEPSAVNVPIRTLSFDIETDVVTCSASQVKTT